MNFKSFYADEAALRTDVGSERVDLLLSLTGKFRSEDWSGNEHVWPVMVNDQDGTVTTELNFGLSGAAICWSVDITSLKAGLLVKKLTVNFGVFISAHGTEALSIFGGGYWGSPVLAHQFLDIWMTLNNPELVDLNDPKDPFANVAGKQGGDIQAWITGWFPMGNNFSGMFDKDVVTLPTDWVALANVFAVDGTNAAAPDPGDAPWRWDIHDDLTDVEGHPAAGAVSDNPNFGYVDAVDNPEKLAPIFFSSCFYSNFAKESGLKGPFALGIGPFDPVQPFLTWLGDCKLNAYDAPMPSARIDFRIAPNTLDKDGNKADINGAGQLVDVVKADTYSRGVKKLGAHDLYAPYYLTWLPATDVAPGNRGARHARFGHRRSSAREQLCRLP